MLSCPALEEGQVGSGSTETQNSGCSTGPGPGPTYVSFVNNPIYLHDNLFQVPKVSCSTSVPRLRQSLRKDLFHPDLDPELPPIPSLVTPSRVVPPIRVVPRRSSLPQGSSSPPYTFPGLLPSPRSVTEIVWGPLRALYSIFLFHSGKIRSQRGKPLPLLLERT